MKRKMTLALAALTLILTLSAFPQDASASATSAPPSDSLMRKAGGGPVVYMEVGLAADILLSVLLP
jgi:hypothetical protein